MDWTSPLGQKARRLLREHYVIWLSTVDASGTPQPRPVWFVSEGDDLVLYSQPDAAKMRHLLANPRVSLHFNSDPRADDDVIVFTGRAAADPGLPPTHENAAYLDKYADGMREMGHSPQEFSAIYSAGVRVKLEHVRGW